MDASPPAPALYYHQPPSAPPWSRQGLVLGMALTEHCNLRCPHCIRDDVTTVRSLDLPLILRTIDGPRALVDQPFEVSCTGGESLPRSSGIVVRRFRAGC